MHVEIQSDKVLHRRVHASRRPVEPCPAGHSRPLHQRLRGGGRLHTERRSAWLCETSARPGALRTPTAIHTAGSGSGQVFGATAAMDVLLVLALGALAVGLALLANKRKVFVDMINELPGPPLVPFFGNLFQLIGHNFEVLALCREVTKDHRDIFRIWVANFAYVALNAPEYVETLLSSVHHIEKSPDYTTLHPWLRTGLLTSTGSKWHARRRLLTPTFHFKILEEFVSVFNRNANILVRRLAGEADRGQSFNIGHYVHLCALDTICESAMGTSVHAQENTESEYVNAVKVACCAAYARLSRPWLYPNLGFYMSALGWQFHRAVNVLHGLTKSVIKTRSSEVRQLDLTKESETSEDGVKKRVAFLDQLLLANEKGAGLSDADIQEEVDTFMFEGHDTTGTAITFGLFELSKNPEVQELAYKEVASVLGTRERDITSQDLAQMKYLDRVVKETLRLYPSVPIFLRRLRTEMPIAGPAGKFVVPAGCTVAVCPYLLHRVGPFWPDPERFDPDRFLPENSAGRHPYAYVPFSAGPRNCIGQKYAMMEMKLMFARLLMEYRFLEAYPGYRPDVVGELILKAKGSDGVLVRLQARADH